MGTLRIMDQSGDRAVAWDLSKPESVDNARKEFNNASNTHLAYTGKGTNHEFIKGFNPDAEEIVMTPKLQGG